MKYTLADILASFENLENKFLTELRLGETRLSTPVPLEGPGKGMSPLAGLEFQRVSLYLLRYFIFLILLVQFWLKFCHYFVFFGEIKQHKIRCDSQGYTYNSKMFFFKFD